jgi:hypothetical protein
VGHGKRGEGRGAEKKRRLDRYQVRVSAVWLIKIKNLIPKELKHIVMGAAEFSLTPSTEIRYSSFFAQNGCVAPRRKVHRQCS